MRGLNPNSQRLCPLQGNNTSPKVKLGWLQSLKRGVAMVMEMDGRQLLVEIDETSNKQRQLLAALDGDINNFQTIINQTCS